MIKAAKYFIVGLIAFPILLQYTFPYLPPAAQEMAADFGLIKPFDSYVDAEFEGFDPDEDDYDDGNYAYDDYDTESDW